MAKYPYSDCLEDVRAWLTANGISPNDVPRNGDLYIEVKADGTRVIVYEAFHRGKDGRIQVAERGNGPAVRRLETSLLVEPPDWWQPHVKPTRDDLLAVVEQVQKAVDQDAPGGDGVAGEYEFGWDAAMAAVKKALTSGAKS